MILQPTDKLLDSTYTSDRGISYQVASPKEGFWRNQRFTTVSRLDGSGLVQIARMEWREWHSPVVHFPSGAHGSQPTSVKAGDFLKKTGWGSSKRVFIAPDGREYRWKSGNKRIVLAASSKTKAPIATFHPKSKVKGGLFHSSETTPAHLEISPEAEHMCDTVLLTFVLMLKLLIDSKALKEAGIEAAAAGIEAAVGAADGGGDWGGGS